MGETETNQYDDSRFMSFDSFESIMITSLIFMSVICLFCSVCLGSYCMIKERQRKKKELKKTNTETEDLSVWSISPSSGVIPMNAFQEEAFMPNEEMKKHPAIDIDAILDCDADKVGEENDSSESCEEEGQITGTYPKQQQ